MGATIRGGLLFEYIRYIHGRELRNIRRGYNNENLVHGRIRRAVCIFIPTESYKINQFTNENSYYLR